MSEKQLDITDRLILNSIQSGFPVDKRPYQILAEKINLEHKVNLTENDIWQRINSLRAGGYIRRLGAIFNAETIGYSSTLCAAKVPQDKLEYFSEIVNQAPEVTHNYLRSDEFNVWFTFSSEQAGDVSGFINDLKIKSGVSEIYSLKAEKLFKIRVNFKFNTDEAKN